jgi:hypothetical protein
MTVHIINRRETWPTAKPFIAADDLVIWIDTAGIRQVSVELESTGLKIVCIASDDGASEEHQGFPVISDQAWVQYVLDSTSLCSWG